MKVLVTGANGNLGSKVVEYLLAKRSNEEIIVGVRDNKSEKARHFQAQGLEVRITNFDDQDTLLSAFKEIDRLFLISTYGDLDTVMRHQTNAIKAAKANGVKKLFYPSIVNADKNDFFLAVMHRAREKAIIESGIPYVILRNNWYVENELDKIQACIKGESWVTSAGNGKIGYVYRPDLAEATANVLIADGHENKIYELSGNNITQQQYVDTVSEVTGKKISLLEVDDATYEKMLKEAGVPEELIFLTIQSQKGIREGVLEADHSDLTFLLERQPTSLKEALIELLVNTKE